MLESENPRHAGHHKRTMYRSGFPPGRTWGLCRRDAFAILMIRQIAPRFGWRRLGKGEFGEESFQPSSYSRAMAGVQQFWRERDLIKVYLPSNVV